MAESSVRDVSTKFTLAKHELMNKLTDSQAYSKYTKNAVLIHSSKVYIYIVHTSRGEEKKN